MKALTPLLLIVIAASIGYWFIYPTYQKTGETKIQIQNYEAALKRAQAASAELVKRKGLYASFEADDKEKLNTFLPDKTDNFRWVVDLTKIADKYRGKIFDVRVTDDGKGTAEVGSVNVAFSTAMPYTNFLSFLADVQKSLKLTDVAATDFITADIKTGVYTYTVTLKSYWLK